MLMNYKTTNSLEFGSQKNIHNSTFIRSYLSYAMDQDILQVEFKNL